MAVLYYNILNNYKVCAAIEQCSQLSAVTAVKCSGGVCDDVRPVQSVQYSDCSPVQSRCV